MPRGNPGHVWEKTSLFGDLADDPTSAIAGIAVAAWVGMKQQNLEALDLDLLDHVSGGMKWQDFRQSENVEDRRPEWAGGPVSNEAWQNEQNGYNNSCWMGADGNQYSGDPSGGEAQQMPDYGNWDGGGDSE